MSVRIGVIDYGMGNRRSVEKALAHIGAEVRLSADRDELAGCHGLVLPGVGAFPAGMASLAQRGLDGFVRERAGAGTPLLGICLGMQLLFEGSEEIASTPGLGLLAGQVRRLDARGQRLPHIGWNEVRFERPSPLLAGLPAGGCPFYHVHSLVAHPAAAQDIVGTAQYGERFATIVGAGTVLGVQFHPEKSSSHGLALLAAFARLSAGVPVASAA